MAVVRIIETCKVSPPVSATESSLPLTFFDTFWFKFHPVEHIFFYELTTDSATFNSLIIPKLKHSLSLTLLHFLPFAGSLIWPSHSDKPIILYTPNDGVSLTVADSNADFHRLSSDRIRQAADSHRYLPELVVSETKAETMSIQITLFPNQGFSLGVSSHHAIFDGKSINIFLKSWAHICKNLEKYNNNNPVLPLELTPFLDRSIVQDPEGIDMVYLNNWISFALQTGIDSNPRSLKLFSTFATRPNLRGTFELSPEDIKKLREKALCNKSDKKLKHFSTFVLTYAYVAITIFKAKRVERNRKLYLGFTADLRARLDSPLPANYVGNCVTSYNIQTEAAFLIEENGLAFVAEKLTEVIKGLEKGALDGAKEKLDEFMSFDPSSADGFGVAGSPRFEVYGTDFGWGKPKKVEVTSIDRTGSISMAESRDGNNGVEVGLVLNKHEMEMFDSLFVTGLKDL